MKQSKYEKETLILTNEEDQYYSVYIFNQRLQKQLSLSSTVLSAFPSPAPSFPRMS